MEVHYIKPLKQYKRGPAQRTMENIDPLLKLPTKITARETSFTPSVNKEDIFRPAKETNIPKISFTKPAFIKPEFITVKTKITLSPNETEKSDSPAYISHSQIVREKIKRCLYQNYNRMETGQVFLSFVLSKDGFLRNVRLVDEKSSPSGYLRTIALQSIKDAAPFPDFPKELDYDQLSFNVVISFEIE
ncbi:MAG: energy transducer TonB [Candidatus Omnitrophica bacterium]|nr:energy transducer TonB [Candidatus Omnitrophota bacterium]